MFDYLCFLCRKAAHIIVFQKFQIWNSLKVFQKLLSITHCHTTEKVKLAVLLLSVLFPNTIFFVSFSVSLSLSFLSVLRDATLVSRMEEKLAASRKLLEQLKAQEQSIQREQKKADTHKKMTEFWQIYCLFFYTVIWNFV